MRFPSYPKFRKSKIEWMETIPQNWEETSIKINFDIQLGKMIQSEPTNPEDVEVPYLRAVHVNWGSVTTTELPRMWASKYDLITYAVQDGDLLVCEGGEVGRAALLESLEEPSIIQNALHRVRNSARGEVRYLGYLLRNIADTGWFSILCNKATIAHLTGEKLGSIVMPVPPISEQRRIADFLDWKTGQIDSLIAKKMELIEKLQEKRIAVITQAVTKGLDPSIPMRDSGVEWLGQVPKHWSAPSLKMRYRVELGKMLDEKRITGEYLVPYLRNTDVQWDNINFEDLPEMDIAEDEYDRYTVKEGDLLVCEGGEVGRSAIVPPQQSVFGYQKALHRLRSEGEDEQSRFMFYIMYFAVNTGVFGASGTATIAHLTAEQLKRYTFPQPPINEQNDIVAYLDKQVGLINKMVGLAEAAITRLTEYRTALITAATTGKIDVRQVKLGSAV